MEGEIYPLLNNLLNAKKIPMLLSVFIIIFLPIMLEIFFIVYYIKGQYETQVVLTLESFSVLIGYIFALLLLKIRIYRSINKYREQHIYCLVGSLPSLLYLLSPGFISLILGILLQIPFISTAIGKKIMKSGHIDPSVLYTLLELNHSKVLL